MACATVSRRQNGRHKKVNTFMALLLFHTCSSRLTIYSSHLVLSLNMFHYCSAYCMTKIASIDLLVFYTEQTLILWCHKCNHNCFHSMLIDFSTQYWALEILDEIDSVKYIFFYGALFNIHTTLQHTFVKNKSYQTNPGTFSTQWQINRVYLDQHCLWLTPWKKRVVSTYQRLRTFAMRLKDKNAQYCSGSS